MLRFLFRDRDFDDLMGCCKPLAVVALAITRRIVALCLESLAMFWRPLGGGFGGEPRPCRWVLNKHVTAAMTSRNPPNCAKRRVSGRQIADSGLPSTHNTVASVEVRNHPDVHKPGILHHRGNRPALCGADFHQKAAMLAQMRRRACGSGLASSSAESTGSAAGTDQPGRTACPSPIAARSPEEG